MATCIERGRTWEVTEYWLEYDRGDGSGYSFPCDELGFVDWQQLKLIARESLAECETGAHGRPRVKAWRQGRRDPSVYACPGGCGGRQEALSSLDVSYCAACRARLEAEYPQGWKYYPGDVCRHGTYVGGCGVDWMCGACETGG